MQEIYTNKNEGVPWETINTLQHGIYYIKSTLSAGESLGVQVRYYLFIIKTEEHCFYKYMTGNTGNIYWFFASNLKPQSAKRIEHILENYPEVRKEILYNLHILESNDVKTISEYFK